MKIEDAPFDTSSTRPMIFISESLTTTVVSLVEYLSREFDVSVFAAGGDAVVVKVEKKQ